MAYLDDGLEKGMAQFNHSDDKLDQGIASPVDCWELVGSGPSSPLPEARVHGSAFEEAMVAACTTRGVLHHDYFASTGSSSGKEVLPLSTVMADQPNEGEGHSSDKSDAHVSLESETGVGENSIDSPSILPMASSDDCNEDIETVHGSSHMLNDSRTHVQGMLPDTRVHDRDNPDCMFLDDHSDDIEPEHSEMTDTDFAMLNSEVTDPNDVLHIGNEIYNYDTVHSDEENVQSIEPTGIADDYQLFSASVAGPQVLQSLSSHDMWSNSSNIQPATAEGDLIPASGEDISRELVGQSEGSPVMQHSIINTDNSRHCKLFECASWLWTHVSRWQAQLGFANTIWSMALAAAVMGILVLGRGWQRLQAQNRSLHTQLWAKEKRITQLMFQLMQTRDSLAKARRVPVMYVKPALRNPHDHA